jgi:hypothetical protein
MIFTSGSRRVAGCVIIPGFIATCIKDMRKEKREEQDTGRPCHHTFERGLRRIDSADSTNFAKQPGSGMSASLVARFIAWAPGRLRPVRRMEIPWPMSRSRKEILGGSGTMGPELTSWLRLEVESTGPHGRRTGVRYGLTGTTIRFGRYRRTGRIFINDSQVGVQQAGYGAAFGPPMGSSSSSGRRRTCEWKENSYGLSTIGGDCSGSHPASQSN